jgi:hypothetical protein
MDVAEHVFGECLVEPFYDVPDVAKRRRSERQQRQTQDLSSFQQSGTALGMYESSCIILTATGR